MRESIFIYWRRNLAGSAQVFIINLLAALVGGTLYSFGVFPSPWMLLVFGVVSPILFTLCTYGTIRGMENNAFGVGLPRMLSSRYASYVAMLVDITIIITLAALIYTNTLNYIFFRLLQTVFFPVMSLLVLRFLNILSDSK